MLLHKQLKLFSQVSTLPANHFAVTIVDECGQAMEAAVWTVVRFNVDTFGNTEIVWIP